MTSVRLTMSAKLMMLESLTQTAQETTEQESHSRAGLFKPLEGPQASCRAKMTPVFGFTTIKGDVVRQI